jgi:uncharacterized membrane protein
VRKKWFLLLASIALSLSIKESVGLSISFIGIMLLIQQRYRFQGLILFLTGILSFLGVSYLGNTLGYASEFIDRYEWMGKSLSSFLPFFLTHPLVSFNKIFVEFSGFKYIFQLLLPVLGFSVCSPLWLIPVIPSLAVNMLSSYDYTRTFWFYYQVDIMPWIFLSTAVSLKKTSILFKKQFKWIQVLILISIVLASSYDSKKHGRLIPGCSDFDKNIVSIDALKSGFFARSIVEKYVPQNSSISATPHLIFPYLIRNPDFCTLEFDRFEAEYILVDLEKLHWDKKKRDELISYIEYLWDKPEVDIIANDYRIILFHQLDWRN